MFWAGSSIAPFEREDECMRQVAVTGLHKAFGAHPVLTGVDLEVPAGSLTAILGPSGSGKTTLLRVVAGFERPDAGTVALGDEVVEAAGTYVAPERRHLGYVPQEGSLFPHLNVERNIAFGLDRRARRAASVRDLIEMVGLSGLERRYPHQLSGGQQQRVALARALAIGPRLVLLDEPFSSLDASMRASVRSDVARVLREAGTTALLVTHDQDEALSMADLVAVIRDGRIGQLDAPDRLYRAPVDPGIARFVGEANLLPGVRSGNTVRTALGELELADPGAAGTAMVVAVRPEQVELLAEPGPGSLTARVVEFEYYGHDAVVRVAAGPAGNAPGDGGPTTPLVVRTTGTGRLEVGTTVGLRAHGPVVAWPDGGATDEPPAQTTST